jgi:predicted alpha/beta-fold hydrolase
MVNRGTSKFKDVIKDAKLFLGYDDKIFKEILDEIKQKYTDKNIYLMGHSLGAKIAETLGDDPQVKNIITLNKPAAPQDLFTKTKVNDKQYDDRTTEDLVSVLEPFQTGQKKGSILKDQKSSTQYFYNLVIKEYLKLMEK